MIPTSQLFEYTKKLSVLFVEDNEELQAQMENIFKTLFKDVQVASNGQIGIDVYTQKHSNAKEPFDLVITDINMPIMNGIDMIKEIYEIIPDQRIIVTSAYNNAEYLIELLNLGISGFLMKPLSAENMTQSFYTVSKAITNEQIIKEHNLEIEYLNKALSNKTDELKNANEELLGKNIALEKSMKIIEGLHHNNQVGENFDFAFERDDKLLMQSASEITEDLEPSLEPINHLKNIELIIRDISMKYNLDGIESDLLEKLSNEIKGYCDTIGQEEIFVNLKKLLKKLAATVNHRPECTKEKELNKIFTTLERFFYVYAKWQDEWKNVDENKIALSSSSIEREIESITSLWTSKSI